MIEDVYLIFNEGYAATAGPSLVRPPLCAEAQRLGTDVPAHKGFAYASWKPVAGLDIVPSLEFASGRATVTPASANGLAPVYYKTEGYVTAALRVDYDLTDRITIGVGGRNLFDRNYAPTDGFPEPGRSFFLGVRARY